MKKTESCYRAFARLVEKDAAPADFPSCCRRLHVLPGVLNERIFRELGVSGEALLMTPGKMICE